MNTALCELGSWTVAVEKERVPAEREVPVESRFRIPGEIEYGVFTAPARTVAVCAECPFPQQRMKKEPIEVQVVQRPGRDLSIRWCDLLIRR